ncbi:hypothetical protein IMSAG185_00919 [Lachnospiraceae bacterium]|nr:hypothetical protein IMSAG185_00919 [Lachnospiraceae bacterium]
MISPPGKLQVDGTAVGQAHIPALYRKAFASVAHRAQTGCHAFRHIAVHVLYLCRRRRVAVAVNHCHRLTALHIQIIFPFLIDESDFFLTGHPFQIADGRRLHSLFLRTRGIAEPLSPNRFVTDRGLADKKFIHIQIEVAAAANGKHVGRIFRRSLGKPLYHFPAEHGHNVLPGSLAVPLAHRIGIMIDLKFNDMLRSDHHRRIEQLIGIRIRIIPSGHIKAQRPVRPLSDAFGNTGVKIQPGCISPPFRFIGIASPGHVIIGQLIHISHRDSMCRLRGDKGVPGQGNIVRKEAVHHLAPDLLRPKLHRLALITAGSIQNHMLTSHQLALAPAHHFHGGKIKCSAGNGFSAVVKDKPDHRTRNIHGTDSLDVVRTHIAGLAAPSVHRPGHSGPLSGLHRLIIPPSGTHHNIGAAVIVDIHLHLKAIADIQDGRSFHNDIALVGLGSLAVKRQLVGTGLFSVHILRRLFSGYKLAAVFVTLQKNNLSRAEFLPEVEHRILVEMLRPIHCTGIFIVVIITGAVLHMDPNDIGARALIHTELVAPHFHLLLAALFWKIKHLHPALCPVRVTLYGVSRYFVCISRDVKVRKHTCNLYGRRCPVPEIHPHHRVFHIFPPGCI